MKFKSVNELSKFSFDNAQIKSFKVSNQQILMELDAMVVKANNSNNARMQDMYCDTLYLRLQDAQIENLLEEGYKYYDANDVLQESVPDREVPVLEYDSVISLFQGETIFTAVEKERETDDGKYEMHFGIDVEKKDDEVTTYWIKISFEKSIAEWERYMNKVME